ncbi:MAG: permease [Candidatus Cloacimonetes bacterium]|nr:permease [Candidatus Cloacimonadota bacterium]
MSWRYEWKILLLMIVVFLTAYNLPISAARFQNAIMESLYMLQEYARLHVIFCLLPALFIAGAISVFISHASVIRYLGARAKKVTAYAVASVSGAILAVCSCTILPLFSGIYKRGAGLGPATTFLYSGPAINILAIILTARVLGVEIGIARAVGAIVFSIIIGLIMAFIFRKEEQKKLEQQIAQPEPEVSHPLWQEVIHFGIMVLILIFANWGAPKIDSGIWADIYNAKWIITTILAILFGIALNQIFKMKIWKILATSVSTIAVHIIFKGNPMITFVTGIIGLSYFTSVDEGELGDWFAATWGFAKQILPLLFIGVLVAGSLLGRPEQEGLIPSSLVQTLVGGNSLLANFFASLAGAFMYFATLTEVPILQGLLGNGMGNGPALALLLAGPALSLPNMLVIRSVMGTKKTVVFVTLVIVMATFSGVIFGMFYR